MKHFLTHKLYLATIILTLLLSLSAYWITNYSYSTDIISICADNNTPKHDWPIDEI